MQVRRLSLAIDWDWARSAKRPGLEAVNRKLGLSRLGRKTRLPEAQRTVTAQVLDPQGYRRMAS